MTSPTGRKPQPLMYKEFPRDGVPFNPVVSTDTLELVNVDFASLEERVIAMVAVPADKMRHDTTYLAYCVNGCTDPTCAYSNTEMGFGDTGSQRLCLFHAHGEGMAAADDGWHVVVWGGAFDDSTHEYSGASLPDWWFVEGSSFETVANPVFGIEVPHVTLLTEEEHEE